MTIQKFAMKDVDEEIQQIVEQQTLGKSGASNKPNIFKALLDKAKIKR